MTKVPIKRALVSVYDKTGLAELAGALAAAKNHARVAVCLLYTSDAADE